MKCENCRKHFNPNTFGETYCPYCGVQVESSTKNKIIKRNYISRRYGFIILFILITFAIPFVFFIINLLLKNNLSLLLSQL